MTDAIEQLETVVRLRWRDVDKAERAALRQRAALAAAEEADQAAAAHCRMARAAQQRAEAARAERPADPLVQLHCRLAAGQVAAADQQQIGASAALDDAARMADELKREVLRAHARHDAIRGELERLVRQRRRRIARRAEEEVGVRPGLTA
jgi:hypothetical protein